MPSSPGLPLVPTRRLSRLVAAVLLLGAAACSSGSETGSPVDAVEIDGLVVEDDLTNDHVDGEVDYPNDPPAGGDHAPVWLDCGFYPVPVPNENAVHTLEHGVVWIAYDEAEVDDDAVDELRSLFNTYGDRMVVSPYDGLDAPVVAVAWERRLEVDTTDDPRLEEFVEAFVNGGQSPEPGASCAGGVSLTG